MPRAGPRTRGGGPVYPRPGSGAALVLAVELLLTGAIRTRTLTDPQWGLRATGKSGATSYTVLAAEDQGGGLMVLPGPAFSTFAPQDFRSTVALGRVRRDFGLSYGFRADLGFVPQVGFREALAGGGLRLYTTGLLNLVRGYAEADRFYLTDGGDLGHDYFPGLFFLGRRNLDGQFELHHNEVKVGGQLLTQRYLTYLLQFDPARRFPRITLQGRVGDLIDFDNGRVGSGTNVSLEATVRPLDHLTLVGDAVREWLDLDRGAVRGRLYTASIERLRVVYVFGARSFLRLIGQYVTTTRDPAVYTFTVPERDGSFLGSLLYSFRLNWQTVFFLGYGDTGVVTDTNDLVHTDRSIFLKVSYAIQH